MNGPPSRLAAAAPDLDDLLTHNIVSESPRHPVAAIECATIMIAMRDATLLATDLYLPPERPAPVVVLRTPYGRAIDSNVGLFMTLARRGFAVVAQDCRGTGDSEPDSWDYYMYEAEDGFDLVEWVQAQPFCSGFIASCGSSYIGQTQWPMALHPAMSTIVPEVSGLGVAVNTVHLYMFLNAHALSVGKGEHKAQVHYSQMERLIVDQTMSGGYFNDPLHLPLPESVRVRVPAALTPWEASRWLWEDYAGRGGGERAELVKDAFGVSGVTTLEVERLTELFGYSIGHDAHTIPAVDPATLFSALRAPALMVTGWYDWALNDTLATWTALRTHAGHDVREQSRLLITPSSHNMPGYREGLATHPELQHNHRVANHPGLLLKWYRDMAAHRQAEWPRAIYYLMGANEWRCSTDWPPPAIERRRLYLTPDGRLSENRPTTTSTPDVYIYDPLDPTPTVGGSIVSYVYPPGSVDAATVQRRADVLCYTTSPLPADLDVVGPLKVTLHVATSAVDTDFAARLSDVFPDGRAVQIQSAMLRMRYRNVAEPPSLLEPGAIYEVEIDMWATANRFKAGHAIRLDISSADFPRYDRNANRGGTEGPPIRAEQRIHRDVRYPSYLSFSVLGES